MANVNITRAKKRHKKRGMSIAAFEINGAEILALITAGSATNADDFQLGVLPKNIYITKSSTIIIEPFVAALTVDLGFAGGTELEAACPLDGAANTVIAGVAGVSIQTGPTVTADFSANPTAAGRAMLIIEYIEYNKVSGELTKFL